MTSGLPTSSARPAVWIALGLVVLVQGLNRLFFGLHWASDVLVGWVAGTTWALTCIAGACGEPAPPGLLRRRLPLSRRAAGARRWFVLGNHD